MISVESFTGKAKTDLTSKTKQGKLKDARNVIKVPHRGVCHSFVTSRGEEKLE